MRAGAGGATVRRTSCAVLEDGAAREALEDGALGAWEG